MHIIAERIYNFGTYAITVTGIVANFETIKSTILFIGGAVLLMLQIRLHILKIKEAKKKKKDNEGGNT